MVAMFLLTAVLGQIVSNTATVLIVTPIAVSAAAATHTSVQPCSCSSPWRGQQQY